MTLAVDERRHGDIMHMPFAVLIGHLLELITERLMSKHPDSTVAIPTQESVHIQFWPANAYTEQAVRYTGRFKVMFGVQVRQLHKDHPDSHYISAALLKYVKAFAVQYLNYVLLVSVDDKSIIPVGEPVISWPDPSTAALVKGRSTNPHPFPQICTI